MRGPTIYKLLEQNQANHISQTRTPHPLPSSLLSYFYNISCQSSLSYAHMASITSNVPALSIEQLVAGHVPSVCSVVDWVHHGSFFAIPIDENVIHDTQIANQFILDPRLTHAWDWVLCQGYNYLSDIVQPVGPYGSHSFVEATRQIGIAPELWLPYIGTGMVAHYIAPLTEPAALDDVIHHAKRAQHHLRRLYGFAGLLRKLIIGRDTIFQCPENATNWKEHAIHCDADILPLINDRDDDVSIDGDVTLNEAKDIAVEQMLIADELHEDLGMLQKQYDDLNHQFALLQKQLAEAISERNVLQTELGRAKGAVSRTLRRVRNAEDYIAALQEDDFGNFALAPVPQTYTSSTPSSTSLSLPYAHISTPETSDEDADMKN